MLAASAAPFFTRRNLALRNAPAVGITTSSETQAPQGLPFKFFVAAVAIAFLALFTSYPLMQCDGDFAALDSVMCGTAALDSTAFHTGWCFSQMAQPIKFGKGTVLATLEDQMLGKDVVESDSASESVVDVEKDGSARAEGLYSG